MARINKGEYQKFRELLRRGIGTRTQKAFAEEVGISKEHLNRMLNNKEISRPSVHLLKSIASHMQTISERMLLEACGYEIEPIKDRVKRFEGSLSEGLNNLVKIDFSQPWKSVTDAIQAMDIQYLTENGRFSFCDEEHCIEAGHHLAEKKMRFSYYWCDDEYICLTHGAIFYSRTENGNLIFLDYDITETDISNKQIMEMSNAEDRLLKAIFKDENEKYVVTTTFGYGFHFTNTPTGFVDFLLEHRGTFCTNKKRGRMLLQIIDDGKDTDKVFEEFDTEKYGEGPGGAVAEILSIELGLYFYYYQHEEKLDEEESPSCIMVEDRDLVNLRLTRQEFLLYLQHAAEVLQIPQFGHLYHSSLAPVQMRMYDTKSFGYEFKE